MICLLKMKVKFFKKEEKKKEKKKKIIKNTNLEEKKGESKIEILNKIDENYKYLYKLYRL